MLKALDRAATELGTGKLKLEDVSARLSESVLAVAVPGERGGFRNFAHDHARAGRRRLMQREAHRVQLIGAVSGSSRSSGLHASESRRLATRSPILSAQSQQTAQPLLGFRNGAARALAHRARRCPHCDAAHLRTGMEISAVKAAMIGADRVKPRRHPISARKRWKAGNVAGSFRGRRLLAGDRSGRAPLVSQPPPAAPARPRDVIRSYERQRGFFDT